MLCARNLLRDRKLSLRLEVGSMGKLEKLGLARARLLRLELGPGSKKYGLVPPLFAIMKNRLNSSLLYFFRSSSFLPLNFWSILVSAFTLLDI